MKRLLALVVALAALLAACGSLGATAVTVNGDRVSQKTVDDELDQIRDNKRYRDAISLSDDTILGSGREGTFKADFAAQVLTLRVYYTLVRQELEKRHLSLSDADLKKARNAVINQINVDPRTGQAKSGQGEKILAAFSKEYRDELIRRQAEIEKLQGSLSKSNVTDADVQKYYDEHKADFDQVCAMHVLVDTKEQADAIKAQLAGGADFATIAAAQSKDPSAKQNKGDLGCAPPSQYVDEFANAVKTQPLNAIGDPVQTQFGWHVIKVYERKTQTLAEVEPQIRQQLTQQGSDALNTWLVAALKKAEVDVNPRFGKFVKSAAAGQLPRVVAPTAPKSAVTTTVPVGGGAPPTSSGG